MSAFEPRRVAQSSSRALRSRGAFWVPVAGILAGAAALAVSAWPAPRPGVVPTEEMALPVSSRDPGPSRLIEIPVTIPQLGVLNVGPHGVTQGSFGTRSNCDVIATLTDANFSGGSYKVEAGFAQTEIFASTYTLTAADFPIKIGSAEAIFATSNTTVTTTTHWSILFWQGEPNTGVLVDSYSSDGLILPHIVLPPGTNGIDVQFSIDTSQGDPPVIINDNGTHKFTVGWRIDHHNQQIGTGCNQGDIPTCCNAFPVVDVSMLQFPTANWLDGMNCGAFGCPPGGGWAKFSQLSSGCRPTGDVVQRVTWSNINCNPGVGPCCKPDGTCQVMTTADCQTAGGTYQGDGTTCSGISCPVPRGACCYSNGFCINNLSSADCTGSGGTWLGLNTQCNGNQCPTGACCMPDGSCQNGVTSTQCAAQGGTFKGVGTTCAGANCPQPTGACCTLNGFCLLLLETDCNGIQGAQWAGPLTTCADNNSDGHPDACPCLADYDSNGFVNGDDADQFFYDFFYGLPKADVNRDGFVNGDDADLFSMRFDAGC